MSGVRLGWGAVSSWSRSRGQEPYGTPGLLILGILPARGHPRRVRRMSCLSILTSRRRQLIVYIQIPRGVDAEEWLRTRERKSINQLLYANMASVKEIGAAKSQAEIDAFNPNEQDLLAVALGAPARQVMLRAEDIGPQSGWADGYLSSEHGFCPPDYDEAAGALAKSPGRIWADLCERMPGCVARGRVQETIAALPLVEGTKEVIPDQALWAAIVALGSKSICKPSPFLYTLACGKSP